MQTLWANSVPPILIPFLDQNQNVCFYWGMRGKGINWCIPLENQFSKRYLSTNNIQVKMWHNFFDF